MLCSTFSWIDIFIPHPIPSGHNLNISDSFSDIKCEQSGRVVILRAATESSLNALMLSLVKFQELHYATRMAMAFGPSWWVMACQNAERKLLMVCTSIFNVFFSSLHHFLQRAGMVMGPIFHGNKNCFSAEWNGSQQECLGTVILIQGSFLSFYVIFGLCPPNCHWK